MKCSFLGALEERGFSLKDVVSICMYVASMDDYAQYNSQYNEFFESQPPVRVCVEAALAKEIPILMEALAYSPQPGNDGSTRQCMHVQGISHWAPANIGPYSQAIWVSCHCYILKVLLYLQHMYSFFRLETSFMSLGKSVWFLEA